MIRILYLILLLSISYGQNIDLYLSLINEGKIDGVKETLPELISKYPKKLIPIVEVFVQPMQHLRYSPDK